MKIIVKNENSIEFVVGVFAFRMGVFSSSPPLSPEKIGLLGYLGLMSLLSLLSLSSLLSRLCLFSLMSVSGLSNLWCLCMRTIKPFYPQSH